MEEIISNFSPNFIIVSHARDMHPDHSATFQFVEKVLTDKNFKGRVFAYLVHYKMYPQNQNKKEFLYPPKKLFSQNGWVSLNLTGDEENKKLESVNQNKSQFDLIDKFIRGFIKRNEIFEEID